MAQVLATELDSGSCNGANIGSSLNVISYSLKIRCYEFCFFIQQERKDGRGLESGRSTIQDSKIRVMKPKETFKNGF